VQNWLSIWCKKWQFPSSDRGLANRDNSPFIYCINISWSCGHGFWFILHFLWIDYYFPVGFSFSLLSLVTCKLIFLINQIILPRYHEKISASIFSLLISSFIQDSYPLNLVGCIFHHVIFHYFSSTFETCSWFVSFCSGGIPWWCKRKQTMAHTRAFHRFLSIFIRTVETLSLPFPAL
jgi:hypothetical protein